MRKLVFMSALGGVSNAAILTAINTGAGAADDPSQGNLWAATLFLVALFVYFKTQVYISTTITAEIEAIIHKLRIRLMDYVRRSELLAVEEIGRSRIIAAITSDSAILTQASNMLTFSIQGPVLIGFVAIYVAYLSFAAFVLSAVILVTAGTIFHFKSRHLTAERAKASAQERRLYDRLADFIDGFKEIRLNRSRSDALFEDTVAVSRNAANIKINAQAETFKQIASTQGYMYILLGAIVFVAPQFSDALGGASIAKITAALLYVIGSCFSLVQTIPILMNANAAADRIAQLEDPVACDRLRRRTTRSWRRRASRRSRCRTSSSPTRTSFRTPRSISGRSTSPCAPANCFSSPAATVRANRRFCGCWPGSTTRNPAKSCWTACA